MPGKVIAAIALRSSLRVNVTEGSNMIGREAM